MTFLSLLKLGTHWSEERLEVGVEILRSDPQIPVQEEEKLLLHQVDLGERKPKALVSSNR